MTSDSQHQPQEVPHGGAPSRAEAGVAGQAAGSGPIQVWKVGLRIGSGMLDRASAVLAADEAARAARARSPARRRDLIASHAALRLILAGQLGCPPRAIAFSTGPHGKPELLGAPAPALHFNLSHSGDFALLALADRPVGVDLEKIRPDRDVDLLAGKVLSPSERMVFDRLGPADRRRAFFTMWTRKEAVAKAHGTGLTAGLSSIEVGLDSAAALLLQGRPAGPAECRLANLAAPPGYVAAVAAAGGALRVTQTEFGWPQDLMQA